MSSADGSSLAAFFCATSMMLLPASIAASSALIDLGLPTNNGITMWGNTTTSRNGKSGSTVGSKGSRVVDMWAILTAQCRGNGDNPGRFKPNPASHPGQFDSNTSSGPQWPEQPVHLCAICGGNPTNAAPRAVETVAHKLQPVRPVPRACSGLLSAHQRGAPATLGWSE